MAYQMRPVVRSAYSQGIRPLCCEASSLGSSTGSTVRHRAPPLTVRATPVGSAMLPGGGTEPGLTAAMGAKSTVPLRVTATGAESVVMPAVVRQGIGARAGWWARRAAPG